MQVLHDPCLNKGTGHSINERERMGLRGLLPPKISSLDEQIERNMERFLDPNKSNIKMTVGSKDQLLIGCGGFTAYQFLTNSECYKI